MPKPKHRSKHHRPHQHQAPKGSWVEHGERAAHRLARMATVRRLLSDPHNPQRALHEAELAACESAQLAFDAHVRRRADRAAHLRRLLSDPANPERPAHADELARIQTYEHRLARCTANAESRMRNIADLRRLAADPSNPRRWKHTDELRRAEAAQARHKGDRGRFTVRGAGGGRRERC